MSILLFHSLLFVNYDTKRCLSCVHLGSSSSKSQSSQGNKRASNINNNKSQLILQPESNTSTIRSTKTPTPTVSNVEKAIATNPRPNVRKMPLKHTKSQSPNRSQTSTLKSTGKSSTTTVHTYQTVECTIDPVLNNRRTTSPSNSSNSRTSTLSPTRSGGGKKGTSSNVLKKGSSSSPKSSVRSSSPLSTRSSRALSPSSSMQNMRALSPTSTGPRVTSAPSTGVSKNPSAQSNILSPAYKILALSRVYRGFIGSLLHSPEGAENKSSLDVSQVSSMLWSCK